MDIHIGVVIVTYNRLNKLRETLDLFDKQSHYPHYIIVVNNASTDNTESFLNKWKKNSTQYDKEVLTMPFNMGGSGGFYAGLKRAQEKDAGWIWVSDDDAFPEIDAIEKAENFLQNNIQKVDSIAAICGMVINNGQIDTMHRRSMVQRGIKVNDNISRLEDYKRDYFEINCFSYVGVIINKNNLKVAGLTNKDYFLWWDDTEHSLRLSKTGKIYCVPDVRIHHDVGKNNEGFTWKLYYNFRNYSDLCKKHFSPISYRWYCFCVVFKTYIKDILRIDCQKNAVIRSAIQDARNNKFGMHAVYKPGWKPEEK